MERSAESISAACRPDSQPGSDGEGLCPSGAAGPDAGGRGAGKGDADAVAGGRAVEPASVPSVRAEPGGAGRCARAAAGGQRELPESEIEREFPGATIAARGDQKPDLGGAPRLYPRRAGVQHRAEELSGAVAGRMVLSGA